MNVINAQCIALSKFGFQTTAGELEHRCILFLFIRTHDLTDETQLFGKFEGICKSKPQQSRPITRVLEFAKNYAEKEYMSITKLISLDKVTSYYYYYTELIIKSE